MTPKVDAGPCLAQARLAVDPEETAAELEPRLAELGAPLVCAAIDAVEAETARAIKQDPALASRARRLRKEDGEIDWRRTASQIKNQIRAMQPWPKSFTFWHRPGGQNVRLIVDRVTACPVRAATASAPPLPGTIVEASGDRLVVAAGEGAVALELIQPAGKRPLSTAEFLRGYRLEPGQRLG